MKNSLIFLGILFVILQGQCKKIELDEFQFQYIKLEYRELSDSKFFSMEKTYFLKLILSGIENHKLNFTEDKYREEFKDKISNIIELIEKENYEKLKESIVLNVMDNVDKWIVQEQRNSVYCALESTIFIISLKFEKNNLIVEYKDKGNDILIFAWTQSVYEEKSTMIKIEGRQDIIKNDPVFGILSDLPEQN